MSKWMFFVLSLAPAPFSPFILLLVFPGQQRCSKAAERDWTRVDRGRLRDKERNRISEQCQKQNRRVVRNNSRRNSPNLENRHVGICCVEYYCKQYQKKYSKQWNYSSRAKSNTGRQIERRRLRDNRNGLVRQYQYGDSRVVGVEYISRELFQVLEDLLCYL